MNPEQEDFESLRQLLALKKYEQPPPRYFSELSGRIWLRIEREPARLSFWQRIFPNVGVSPTFAYSFGLLACGSLFLGIAYSLNNEPQQSSGQPMANGNWPENSPRLATTDGIGMKLEPFRATQMASTNPVMNAEPLNSLFDGFRLRVQAANFSPSP
ncbi:MAG: hypothetical protein ABIQ35_05125 [Verrucomicrobiota bacterium]